MLGAKPNFLEKVKTDFLVLKVTGIRPLPLSKTVFHLKLMQRKTLNFVINLPDVENTTKWLDSILTQVSSNDSIL